MAEPVIVKVREVVYPSCRAAAKALGVNHSTISRRLDKGTLDEMTNHTADGEKY